LIHFIYLKKRESRKKISTEGKEVKHTLSSTALLGLGVEKKKKHKAHRAQSAEIIINTFYVILYVGSIYLF
jgi:hypothetical protein